MFFVEFKRDCGEVCQTSSPQDSPSTLGVIRTRDPLLRKQVLYPLSYEGMVEKNTRRQSLVVIRRGGRDSNPRARFPPPTA